MKVVVYSAHEYQRRDDRVFGDRAFVLFLGELARRVGGMRLLGRLAPGTDRCRYELDPELEFVALHHYASLANPVSASISTLRSAGLAWRAVDGADCIWVLGPHPLGFLLALIALLRRRRLVLGVRQDMPAYVRRRHPGRRSLQIAGLLLELGWRALARVTPTVVVGPELATKYSHASELHELIVSLVPSDEIVAEPRLEPRTGHGPHRILSVGRVEEEKNPLLLADVLADLGSGWELTVCGEGPLLEVLSERIAELGLASRATLTGYLPHDALAEQFRRADVMFSPSWTEGFPQTFVEAFAAGIPVVSTDVGGIRRAAGQAVALIEAGDRRAAGRELTLAVEDPEVRRRLIESGLTWVRRHTLDIEAARLAKFLVGPHGSPD